MPQNLLVQGNKGVSEKAALISVFLNWNGLDWQNKTTGEIMSVRDHLLELRAIAS
jgi:hypothetical protein